MTNAFQDDLIREHTYEEVILLFKSKNPTEPTDLIEKAYELASICLYEKNRRSCRSYLQHCINIAYYVCYFGLGKNSISAAFLHDSLDFGLTLVEIEKETNSTVPFILKSLDNIKSIKKYQKSNIKNSDYSDYMRRLIIEFSKDTRPIIIRLCEVLDALYDVSFLETEERESSFTASYKIYAPLAEFLGLSILKTKIEDLAFFKQKHKTYLLYKRYLDNQKILKRDNQKNFEKKLKKALFKAKIEVIDFFGRKKGVYSFYIKSHKLQSIKHIFIKQARLVVDDKIAYTILVKDVEMCYKTIDLLHSKFSYVEREYNDYIHQPKVNGFRCLQTKIQIFDQEFIEIQIKTLQMHEVNEYGVASHVYYKLYGSDNFADNKKLELLQNLVKWKKEFETEERYSIKAKNDTVLIFSPKGEVFELEEGSVPLDFAYKLHTKLGNTYRFAKVNEKFVKCDYALQSGDIVEIITDNKKQHPSREWLQIVKTKFAKDTILKGLKSVL